MSFLSQIALLKYKFCHAFFLWTEWARYAAVSPGLLDFWVVSCSWNSGPAVLNCLDSVYQQAYPREHLTHLFIDDCSSDDTQGCVAEWMRNHVDHSVKYIRNDRRAGGTKNTLDGFQMVPGGAIAVELNGDDRLPDKKVIPFLSKVYADSAVWMTYNSYRYADKGMSRKNPIILHPVPQEVIRENNIREYPWMTRHLHSFRSELFNAVDDSVFIDPESGDFWESADDQAMYLAMFELAGMHTRHIYRDMYVYNHRSLSDDVVDFKGSEKRMKRIREMPRYEPLGCLPGEGE